MLFSQTCGYSGEKEQTRVVRNDRETRFTALSDSGDFCIEMLAEC